MIINVGLSHDNKFQPENNLKAIEKNCAFIVNNKLIMLSNSNQLYFYNEQ